MPITPEHMATSEHTTMPSAPEHKPTSKHTTMPTPETPVHATVPSAPEHKPTPEHTTKPSPETSEDTTMHSASEHKPTPEHTTKPTVSAATSSSPSSKPSLSSAPSSGPSSAPSTGQPSTSLSASPNVPVPDHASKVYEHPSELFEGRFKDKECTESDSGNFEFPSELTFDLSHRNDFTGDFDSNGHSTDSDGDPARVPQQPLRRSARIAAKKIGTCQVVEPPLPRSLPIAASGMRRSARLARKARVHYAH
jgi:outer membrane biosynthesis protein TonB